MVWFHWAKYGVITWVVEIQIGRRCGGLRISKPCIPDIVDLLEQIINYLLSTIVKTNMFNLIKFYLWAKIVTFYKFGFISLIGFNWLFKFIKK